MPQLADVPRSRRLLFRGLSSVIGNVDARRVWNRVDLDDLAAPAGAPHDVELPEVRLERMLRPHWAFVVAAILAVALGGVLALWVGLPGLAGRFGMPIDVVLAAVAGFLLHGLVILVVHEATHGNLLGGARDRWLGNIALGMLLLPFLAESYQQAHLVHHRSVNERDDNNWTRYRHALFRRARWLYVLYELLPVVNNIDRATEGVPRRRAHVLASWAAALVVVAVCRPSPWWWLAVVVAVNTVNAHRLWIEHYGIYSGRVANTYSAPLSFGIGHHALHHMRPRIPGVVLMVGLWFRRKDATLWSALPRVLFDRRWMHFRLQQPDVVEGAPPP